MTSSSSSSSSLDEYTKRTYENTLSLIKSLTTQLQNLINNEGKVFYEYRTKDIFVIEKQEDVTFSCESKNFLEINPKKQKIKFTKPFNREDCFISPEIKNMKQLPTEISYKTIYYSLGSLAIFFLTNKTFVNEEEAIELLKPIAYTKLYWLILRTLDVHAERRSILYI
jgi:hypothetical protein